MQYELFYLVSEINEQKLPQIKEEVTKIVESEDGKWLEPEIIEKRKMAYKIKGQSRGIYIARRFEIIKKETGGKNEIQNISKKIRLNSEILRSMIVKASELPELKPHEKTALDKFLKTPTKKEEEISYEYEKDFIAENTEVKKETTTKKNTISKKETQSIDEKLEEILNI